MVESRAIPVGFKNPVANVVTTPTGVIFLILLFVESTTYRFLAESIVTSVGVENCANAPIPFCAPAVVEPASVLTFSGNTTLRILLLALSAMYTFPLESVTIPFGALKAALPEISSIYPAVG